jgi:polysaccharide deacetylase 2 family uncharacterized protein YibQ
MIGSEPVAPWVKRPAKGAGSSPAPAAWGAPSRWASSDRVMIAAPPVFCGSTSLGAAVERETVVASSDRVMIAAPSEVEPQNTGGALVSAMWASDSRTTGAPALGLPVSETSTTAQAIKNPAAVAAPITGLANGPSDDGATGGAFAGGKPRVALIIGGLGLNAKTTREAIQGLPADVTLSFVPYADDLQSWIDQARAAGHEVLLEAPMEPKDYPVNDPGPFTLMADGQPQETTRRLEWLLSRATGYFGVTNYLGSKFVASPTAMSVFESDLRQRGLAFIDDGSAAQVGGGVPRASADRIVDDQLDGGAIEAQLTALETQATRAGHALGSGFAYPVTLAEAARWTQGLAGRGIDLVPASALTTRR